MYFVISHFTKNLWTTDYLLEYFRKSKKKYLFLRHPFQTEKDLEYSELLEFDGEKGILLKQYKKINNFVLEMIRNEILTFYIALRYLFKYQKVIAFWWFNFFPILWTRLFAKLTYFRGVDYSRKRFKNKILNSLYLFFETLWCLFAKKVVNLTTRQERARLNFHFLNKKKSIVIPSWFQLLNFHHNFLQNQELCFFYLGSITPQHWIVDFVRYFYVDHKTNVPLYIMGWWELEEQLIEIIKKNNLSKRVFFLGRKDRQEVVHFLQDNPKKWFWIAPYSDQVNDHVYYGDSLKIREYLWYNMPFLVSKIAYVASDLQKFGIIFEDFQSIDFEVLKNFSFDYNEKNICLEKYTRDNLFSMEF